MDYEVSVFSDVLDKALLTVMRAGPGKPYLVAGLES
jgi:hypothetical protein